MRQFIGDCVNNPFNSLDQLERVIDQAIPITRNRFLQNCDIKGMELYGISLSHLIAQYPHDFEFSQSNKVIFFTHSAVEYFFR